MNKEKSRNQINEEEKTFFQNWKEVQVIEMCGIALIEPGTSKTYITEQSCCKGVDLPSYTDGRMC